MNLSLIPAVLFLTIIYFSGNNEKATNHKVPDEVKKITFRKDHDIDFKSVEITDSEYQKNINTIYNFITKKFTKIGQEDAERISKNLVDYGKKYELDPKLAAAVIARESSFNKEAISETGAKGLGQIKDFNFNDLSINDPFNIDQNVSGTVKYLKKMIKNWKEIPENAVGNDSETIENEEEIDVKLGLASYFKGFTAVKNKGIDTKTKKYVEDIMDYYKEIIEFEEKSLENKDQ